MIKTIDPDLLKKLNLHVRQLSKRNFFLRSSMRYERCGEFPWVISRLKSMFNQKLNYLDIGSGDSALPSFILKNTQWDISCLDKFDWVKMQYDFARKVMPKIDFSQRFRIIIQDLLKAELPHEHFDIITNISVIEHFEKNLDISAMKKSAKLLKQGGLYLLTTPLNEPYYKEFFQNKKVYGEPFTTHPVFFQRHYDVKSFNERVVNPSGLTEIEHIYMGEYGFQFKETFLDLPFLIKPFKILYQWATPYFAKRFLTYRDYPISRPKMKIYTSSTVLSVLKKL